MTILILLLLLTPDGQLAGATVVGPANDQVDCAAKAAEFLEANAKGVAAMKEQGLSLAVRCVDAKPHPVAKGTKRL